MFKSEIPKQFLFLISKRTFAFEVPNPLPVIKVPKYLEASIKQLKGKLKKEEAEFRKRVSQRGNRNIPVISSRNHSNLNHYLGQTYSKDSVIQLISNSWMNSRSIGDQMTFHPFCANKFTEELNAMDEVKTDNSFTSLGLSDTVAEAIKSMHYKGPVEIQRLAIPAILSGNNVLCCAETGCGKTLAYMASVIEQIRRLKEKGVKREKGKSPLAIIVVPNRELAIQVGNVALSLGTYCGVGVAVNVGGLPQRTLHTGYDLIVSTVGIVTQHVEKRIYKVNDVKTLIIDEADTVLDDSFNYSIYDLFHSIRFKEKDCSFASQLVLVSATIPSNLGEVIGNYVDVDGMVKVTTSKLHCVMPHVKQVFMRIHKYDRQLKILEMIQKNVKNNTPTIIFTNRTKMCNFLYHHLNDHQIPCLRLNKTVPDEERRETFKKFQEGEYNVLVSTDVGSRGLDTTRVKHVINYESPHYVSDYIHRAGRTGRIGSGDNCLVTSFISFKPDVNVLQSLEFAVRKQCAVHNIESNIKQAIYKRKNPEASMNSIVIE